MEPVQCDLEGSRKPSPQRAERKHETQHMPATVQYTNHLSLLRS